LCAPHLGLGRVGSSLCLLAFAARFHPCLWPLSKALKWQVVIEKNVKIIIVDSVASLARHEFNGAALASRQAELTKEAQTLKFLGENNNIPIIVTNQVTTRYSANLAAPHRGIPHQPSAERDCLRDDESFLTAALGPAWSHCVNTRIVLEQNAQTRLLTVAKSPIAPVTQINFEITVCNKCCISWILEKPESICC
jgi:RAD51-like protein 1